MRALSRRKLLGRGVLLAAGARQIATPAGYPIVDIHQHTPYSGRSAVQLVAHQRSLGIAKTVLLPAGRRYGLAAGVGGNQVAVGLAHQYPGEYYYFANELPDLPETQRVIEQHLNTGAIGIGEQKFPVDCDSKFIQRIAEIARHYEVPVLLHFEHGAYNFHLDRFYRVLEKFPQVNFIGHAQTWWGNIDRRHDQTVMYPKTKVTPGGITDRYLADYPNIYGDLSAGSGQNSMLRDEEHARDFLSRHQDKLLFGSDCSDPFGKGPKCIGSKTLATIRRLAPDQGVVKKILHDNAVRIMRIA